MIVVIVVRNDSYDPKASRFVCFGRVVIDVTSVDQMIGVCGRKR
jgi:hypothetical protein